MRARVMLVAALLMVTWSSSAQVLSRVQIASIGGANALSPPAARHMVTIGGTLLLAMQHDSGDTAHPGLWLWRSDDNGQSWSAVGPIAATSDRDTVDMVAVDNDVYMVY